MKKITKTFFLLIVHLIAIGVIIYSFSLIALWYINFRPIWGVDFYNTVTLTQFLKENLTWPHSGWIYFWFNGFPLLSGYPLLHNYLILPLTFFFDLVISVQLWSVIAAATFVIGAYFLFFVLSRNLVLSAILSIATAYSAGVYQTLTWAGSIPAFATQAFFPWVLGFIVLYNYSSKFRHLLTAALLAGVSIWGHQQVFVVYIFPAVTILLFLNFVKGFRALEKLKSFLIFVTFAVILGLPQILPTLGNALKVAIQPAYTKSALSTTTLPPSQIEIDIANFNKAQVARMITDNNDATFLLLIIAFFLFTITLVFARKLGSIFSILPFLVMAFYFAFYIWLFGQGIAIFHGGWYRLFWSVPIWVGALASIFWYQAAEGIDEVLTSKFFKIPLIIFLNLAILLVGGFLVFSSYPNAIWKIIYRSQPSSAYPDILNLETEAAKFQVLKKKLTPSWLNGDRGDFRFYDGDQTVNIWWNSFYDMPLSRGYLDPPHERGFLFWTDAALSETDGEPQLVKSFGYPKDSAISNAQFLIDWNAVKFYEGGHTGDAFTPFPKFLSELIAQEEVLDFNDKKYTKRPVTLKFTEVKDEYTSPIMAATNAQTLGIFATDAGFETVVRAIAERSNLNSQILIPVKLGKFVDSYDGKTLKKFDALYLYDYDYKNFDKVFARLTDYVASGKKVFIETGVEVKQSAGTLSEFFPVKKVERTGLGKTWELENQSQTFGKEVNFSGFAPPIFDETEWKMSYAEESDLRGGGTTILKNHGKVVLASQKIGGGEVIWSGLNLAYHQVRYHNLEEAKFFQNILANLVDLSRKPTSSYQTKFINSTTREIETSGAKAILFKENAYSGWKANFENSSGKMGELKIFRAGPSTPGFMYIPLTNSGKIKVKFTFTGSPANRVVTFVSVITGVLVLEELLIGGFVIGRFRRKLWHKTRYKISGWWEKEDEG